MGRHVGSSRRLSGPAPEIEEPTAHLPVNNQTSEDDRMSERAKLFVESWVTEYVHPTAYENAERHAQSRANAVACYESALIEGITKDEINEEFPNLVTYIAGRHEQIIDGEVDRLLRKE
jgi:hypothetical protein